MEKQNASPDALALNAAKEMLAELHLDAYIFGARLSAGRLRIDLEVKRDGRWCTTELEADEDAYVGGSHARREAVARWRSQIAALSRAA